MKAHLLKLLILVSISLVPASNCLAQAKIVGGNNVPNGNYPWMAALISSGTGNDAFQAHFCGGALIDPYWVLTAAHCVDGSSAGDIEVVVDVNDLSDISGGERRGVRGIYIHPTYTDILGGSLSGDIALLLLDAPITTVTPVSFGQSASLAAVGQNYRAIGWGNTQTQANPSYPTILQQADLQVILNSTASSAYGQTFDSRFIAAQTAGRDTCQGDSGGPLFSTGSGPGTEVILGITSFGVDCASVFPGIYTNIGAFAPWVNIFLAQPTGPDPTLSVANIPDGAQDVLFGRTVKAGKRKTTNFTLTNAPGTIPLALQSTTVSGRYFEIVIAPRYVLASATDSLIIRFRAPKKKRSKKYRGNVVMLTNEPSDPVYAFGVRAKAKKKKKKRPRQFFR